MTCYIIEVDAPNIITHNSIINVLQDHFLQNQNALQIARNIVIVLLILKNFKSSRL